MTQAALSALILAATLILFVSKRVRHDLVALLALLDRHFAVAQRRLARSRRKADNCQIWKSACGCSKRSSLSRADT